MNLHKQLQDMITALNEGQPRSDDDIEGTFDFVEITIDTESIRMKWEPQMDAVELDLGVLHQCVTRLGFRAVIGQCEGLTLNLFPIEGGAA